MHNAHLTHTLVADRQRALLAAAHTSHLLAAQPPKQRRLPALPVTRWFAGLADGCRVVTGSTAAYPHYDRLIRWQ